MKIKEITIRKNKPSRTDKFQHTHVELRAEVDEGEDFEKVYLELESQVDKLLSPELVTLRARLSGSSPTVSKLVAKLSDDDLDEIYDEYSSFLESYIKGDETVKSVCEVLRDYLI